MMEAESTGLAWLDLRLENDDERKEPPSPAGEKRVG